MVKSLDQRGFEVSNGKRKIISYRINNDGLEVIDIDNNGTIMQIIADDGQIENIYVDTHQIKFYLKDQDRKKHENYFQQAKAIYNEVIKMLDVNNKIKEYVPKFSSVYEMTLYNILGIESVSDLKKLSRK